MYIIVPDKPLGIGGGCCADAVAVVGGNCGGTRFNAAIGTLRPAVSSVICNGLRGACILSIPSADNVDVTDSGSTSAVTITALSTIFTDISSGLKCDTSTII
ncbi:hypothetical protein DERP_005127 [Dermatophagoides pteronyssinus]|uniref:Uncharacterized protein n=1 Tax=Dermatophagoides pteronyssinus TaxID=6956 RepID=A0ABQ8JTG0_DERPT|nr:hypothetical protein DERP_005127 [Dermatophagoides pteronyssinus]